MSGRFSAPPGRAISRAPQKPAMTAIQCAPEIDSLSSQCDRITTTSGVTNRKAVLSASGIMEKPIIEKPVVPTSISARAIWAMGREVAISCRRIEGARKISIIRQWKV